MKSVFDMVLIIIICFLMIFCMLIFCEEVLIRQQGVHLRDKINELVEINSGYTSEVEDSINVLLENFNYEYDILFSKNGKLLYGEELIYIVKIYYERYLPFYEESQKVEFIINGQYYNIN